MISSSLNMNLKNYRRALIVRGLTIDDFENFDNFIDVGFVFESGQGGYASGYQARCDGQPLSNLNEMPRGKRLPVYIKAWRTGWFDADHDLLYSNKHRKEEV